MTKNGPTSVALAQLLFERWEAAPDGPDVDWFLSAALAVRDAVCPPGYVVVAEAAIQSLRDALKVAVAVPEGYRVVPAAEHDELRQAVADARNYLGRIIRHDPKNLVLRDAYFALANAADDYAEALKEDA